MRGGHGYWPDFKKNGRPLQNDHHYYYYLFYAGAVKRRFSLIRADLPVSPRR